MANSKLILVKDLWYPTKKANALQTFKMASAFSKILSTELWIPKGKIQSISTSKLNSQLDIDCMFTIRKIQCFYRDSEAPVIKNIYSYLFKISFYFNVFKAMLSESRSSIIFSREPETIILAKLLSFQNIIFEIHEICNLHYEKILTTIAKNYAKLTIYISRNLKLAYRDKTKQNLVEPDAVDTSWLKYDFKNEKKIRVKLKIPISKNIISYIGSNLEWKGVDTLISTSRIDKDVNNIYIFVGFEGKNTKNNRYFGFLTQKQVKQLLSISNILILPTSGKYNIGRYYCSPLKLFEYMATKKPIIASDLPSIKEIITKVDAWFFDADNPRDLLAQIRHVQSLKRDHTKKKSVSAFSRLQNYTWDKRAKRIINKINSG